MLYLKEKQISLPVVFVVAYTYFPSFTKKNNQFIKNPCFSYFISLSHPPCKTNVSWLRILRKKTVLLKWYCSSYSMAVVNRIIVVSNKHYVNNGKYRKFCLDLGVFKCFNSLNYSKSHTQYDVFINIIVKIKILNIKYLRKIFTSVLPATPIACYWLSHFRSPSNLNIWWCSLNQVSFFDMSPKRENRWHFFHLGWYPYFSRLVDPCKLKIIIPQSLCM